MKREELETRSDECQVSEWARSVCAVTLRSNYHKSHLIFVASVP